MGHWGPMLAFFLVSQWVVMHCLQKVCPQGMVTGNRKRSRHMAQFRFAFWDSIIEEDLRPLWEKRKNKEAGHDVILHLSAFWPSLQLLFKLQLVRNAAARIISSTHHPRPLHWLPVQNCKDYKISQIFLLTALPDHLLYPLWGLQPSAVQPLVSDSFSHKSPVTSCPKNPPRLFCLTYAPIWAFIFDKAYG